MRPKRARTAWYLGHERRQAAKTRLDLHGGQDHDSVTLTTTPKVVLRAPGAGLPAPDNVRQLSWAGGGASSSTSIRIPDVLDVPSVVTCDSRHTEGSASPGGCWLRELPDAAVNGDAGRGTGRSRTSRVSAGRSPELCGESRCDSSYVGGSVLGTSRYPPRKWVPGVCSASGDTGAERV